MADVYNGIYTKRRSVYATRGSILLPYVPNQQCARVLSATYHRTGVCVSREVFNWQQSLYAVWFLGGYMAPIWKIYDIYSLIIINYTRQTISHTAAHNLT